MIVTDKDAREKYCPIIGGKCMGEECMAWTDDLEYGEPTYLEMKPQPQPAKKTGKGYCGMVRNGR